MGGLTLTFQDSNSETIEGSIDINDDYKDEGPESFEIFIASSSEGNIVESSDAAVVIIKDTGM